MALFTFAHRLGEFLWHQSTGVLQADGGQRTDMDCLDLPLCREIITASNCPELELSREQRAPKQRERLLTT